MIHLNKVRPKARNVSYQEESECYTRVDQGDVVTHRLED